MYRWLTVGLVAVTLAAAAFLLGSTPQLPDRVATHFDWGGNPNGWMDRAGYLAFMLVFAVALPWLVYAVGRLHRPAHEQDHRLAPARNDAQRDAVRTFTAWAAIATAVFIVAMHFAIVGAHAAQPIRLDNGQLMIFVALFAAVLIGLAVAHALRSSRARDRSLRH